MASGDELRRYSARCGAGEYQLGIIRYKPSAEAYYAKQAAECGLKTELLLEYDERLLMSQAHPWLRPGT